MNRPAVGPQSLRGLPNGFPSQQQIPQNRTMATRIPPSSKISNNGATWAFGGGVPMGSAGLGAPRPGPMTSFAQTIGGSSQSSTPLDLSEFPSLSNSQPQPSQSTWAASGSRSLGPSGMRLSQQSSLSAQQQLNSQQHTQQQQDDLFSSSSQLPGSQAGFRFSSQNAVGQASHSNNVEEFPPLNRNVNGDIGHERSSNLTHNNLFGAQSNGLGFGSANPPQPNRGNGLLNVLSGSGRVGSGSAAGNRAASPASLSAVSNSRSPIESSRQGLSGVSEHDSNAFSTSQFGQEPPSSHPTLAHSDGPPNSGGSAAQPSRKPPSNAESSPSATEEPGPEIQDPLAHMSAIDRWGLKGFSMMMNNFPDYAALVTGSDLTTLGLDLSAPDPIAPQVYSLWDNEQPRPSIPPYILPECYTVGNVAPLDSKMPNLNDEALMFMFYSNPGDLQQVMAAQELHNRNWRYHKKLQLWLTKDDMMVPQAMGNGTERGYYIFFDIKQWHRERRELTLVYDDLENIQIANPRIG